MTTTPQLVDKPKARLKAGLRRIALTKHQLAEQFLEVWPDYASTPDSFMYDSDYQQWAWESFWEDVSQWSDWITPDYAVANYNNPYVSVVLDVVESILKEDDAEWYPVRSYFNYNDLEPGTEEEWWFQSWITKIVPKFDDDYIGALAEFISIDPDLERWISAQPPGVGAEISGEEGIVLARKVSGKDIDVVHNEDFIRNSYLFRNWFSSDLSDNITFADIVKAVVNGDLGEYRYDERLQYINEAIWYVVDNKYEAGGNLEQLLSEEERIRYYVDKWDELDDEKIRDTIRDEHASFAEEIVNEQVASNAEYHFKSGIIEKLDLDGVGEETSFGEIGDAIARDLESGKLAPETLVEAWRDYGIFGNSRRDSYDLEDLHDLMEDWHGEIEGDTIHWDDEDYARSEQQIREHEYWMQQRRNRTPQGNIYDVGDRVMFFDSEYTVTHIQKNRGDSGDFFFYSLWNDEKGNVGAREEWLKPVPQPQQTMWPQEDLEPDVTASILDEPAETLDPMIFDLSENSTAPKMRDEVREKIIDQLQKARVNPDAIKAILFFGSSAAYQYDPDSDFDIAVVVDPSLTRQGEEILGLNHHISNELFIGGHPVTYYFREDEYPVDGSDSIYDLVGNFWIRVPERSESAIGNPEYDDTIDDAREWAKVLDVQIGELRRDVIDYEKLQSAYQRSSDERKHDLYDRVQDVISQLNADVAALANESDELHATRLKAFQDDLEEAGEDAAKQYLSRNWMPENVLYKVLERYRYTKLLKMMDKLNKEGLFDDQNQLKIEYNQPIKSAMGKPEDEIEPGDHMKNHRNRDVIVEDTHDAEDGYQYEMYKTVDDRGKLDEVEKLDLIMVDENPERLLPTENPEMKTAAAGGTGYGDYQEKITDSSGTSMAGDVSGSHEPDVYPMDQDKREGTPVPSIEFEKSKQKSKEIRHRNSVVMRTINALATEIVGTIRMGMHRINQKRKAQVDQNKGVDHNTFQSPASNPGPYQPQNVAGNPLGGGYSINETQQGEQATGEASEEENMQATQQRYDQNQQGKELAEQMQANDMTQQYQLRMMGAGVEEKKLQIIMGSSFGAENPADSSVSQLESSNDGRLRSKTNETRKVMLHEMDEDAKSDNATFPKVDDQLKPLP